MTEHSPLWVILATGYISLLLLWHYQDIRSPTPIELRPWGWRAGFEDALTVINLLDAVKEPDQK